MNVYINREEFSELIKRIKLIEVDGMDILKEYNDMINEIKEVKIK